MVSVREKWVKKRAIAGDRDNRVDDVQVTLRITEEEEETLFVNGI